MITQLLCSDRSHHDRLSYEELPAQLPGLYKRLYRCAYRQGRHPTLFVYLHSSQIILAEPLFDVNENIVSVKTSQTEPRRASARTATILRPIRFDMTLVPKTLELSFFEHLRQKLLEFFMRARPSIKKVLCD